MSRICSTPFLSPRKAEHKKKPVFRFIIFDRKKMNANRRRTSVHAAFFFTKLLTLWTFGSMLEQFANCVLFYTALDQGFYVPFGITGNREFCF